MKKYPSKIGYGLVFFILAILIGTTIPILSPPRWTGIFVNLGVLVLLAHVFATTHYVIADHWLVIKMSFFTYKKIDINTIEIVAESNSLISSPAMSLDRLNIIFERNKGILISPRDKSGFIAHLIGINPEIEVSYK